MNKVILMGRLVKEPEVRYSQGAESFAIARYTLAANRRFKRQGEPEADFINCVAFGKTGEFAEKYFKKGQLVSVVGRLQVRKPLWQMIQDWDAWQPLHKEVRVVAGKDAFRQLKTRKPDVPVLIVEGKSPGNKFPEHPEILDYLPNGRMLVLEDCGHMMNMERPEEFNKALREFISKVE